VRLGQSDHRKYHIYMHVWPVMYGVVNPNYQDDLRDPACPISKI
jgi:hypothetical protein